MIKNYSPWWRWTVLDNSIGIHHTRNQTFIHFGQHPEEIVESIKLSMYDFPVSTADRIRKLHSNLSELANQSTCAGQIPSAKIGRDLSLPRYQFPWKKGRKNWRSHLLKRGYGVVNSDLTTDLWLCQLGQVPLVFFFRLDFSITLWRYSLELHRFSQYRVTELHHICIHGYLTHTAGCELCKRWKYTSLLLFQPCFLCHSRQ